MINPKVKTSNPKRVKQQHTIGSGAKLVEEELNGAPEPEEIMMIEVTWMQPYLAYMIKKTTTRICDCS
jgi:hypothetical protein